MINDNFQPTATQQALDHLERENAFWRRLLAFWIVVAIGIGAWATHTKTSLRACQEQAEGRP